MAIVAIVAIVIFRGPGPALLDGWAGLAAGRRRRRRHLDHT